MLGHHRGLQRQQRLVSDEIVDVEPEAVQSVEVEYEKVKE